MLQQIQILTQKCKIQNHENLRNQIILAKYTKVFC